MMEPGLEILASATTEDNLYIVQEFRVAIPFGTLSLAGGTSPPSWREFQGLRLRGGISNLPAILWVLKQTWLAPCRQVTSTVVKDRIVSYRRSVFLVGQAMVASQGKC